MVVTQHFQPTAEIVQIKDNLRGEQLGQGNNGFSNLRHKGRAAAVNQHDQWETIAIS